MHPRFLVGPTLFLLGILLAGAGALWAMKPGPPDPEQQALSEADLYAADADTVKAFLGKEFQKEMMTRIVGGIILCAVVCYLPMKRGALGYLTRAAVFGVGGMLMEGIRHLQNQNTAVLLQFMFLGGLVIAAVVLMKGVSNKPVTESKQPAHRRWMNPSHGYGIQPDDPVAVERLEQLRAAAAGPPPSGS